MANSWMASGFCKFDNTKWKLGAVLAFNTCFDLYLQDTVSIERKGPSIANNLNDTKA